MNRHLLKDLISRGLYNEAAGGDVWGFAGWFADTFFKKNCFFPLLNIK